MSTVIDDVVLWVCVDCLQHAAGITESERGEPYPLGVTEGVERMARDNYPASVTLVPGSGDHHDGCEYDATEGEVCNCEYDNGGFSWSRCEACLSPLGGDRYAVTLLVSIPS